MSTTNPDAMDIDPLTPTIPATTTRTVPTTTATLKTPPFSYARLSLLNPDPTHPTSPAPPLDALQVRSYLTAALRQFLGDTGAAIPIDILQLQSPSVWVRVPRSDLAAFAAGVTAFAGLAAPGNSPGRIVLQVRACGDWLGALLGSGEEGEEEEAGLWG